MKFKLGPLENARTFYSPKGNTTVVRDTIVTQVNPPQTQDRPAPACQSLCHRRNDNQRARSFLAQNYRVDRRKYFQSPDIVDRA